MPPLGLACQRRMPCGLSAARGRAEPKGSAKNGYTWPSSSSKEGSRGLPANRFLRLASLQSCISSAPDRNGFHARLRLDGFCAEMGIRKDVLVEKSFSVLRRSGWQLRFHVSKVEVLCRAQACWCCYSVLLVRKFGDCPTYPKFCHLCRLLMVWEIVDLSIVM